MPEGRLLILDANDVESVLRHSELDILTVIRRAYELHHAGETSLPHSQFLRFPGSVRDRIIALPAYVGGEFNAAGLKWISSFPANVNAGMDRASALLVLNSASSGRPYAIMEATAISAKRTAASACLAVEVLLSSQAPLERLGIIGCGPINYEVLRFLRTRHPGLNNLTIFDIDWVRAEYFKQRLIAEFSVARVTSVRTFEAVLAGAEVVSIATTCTTPYLSSTAACPRNALILHISLRDLAPEVVLNEVDNIVDDPDHVCRAGTSLHLAEELANARDFIVASLPAILAGAAGPLPKHNRPKVFSPFGLGILDVALATYVHRQAENRGLGIEIDTFFPDSWDRRTPATERAS